MDPQQLPLEPLIAPPPVSWWPLAPVWWIGLILLIAIVIIILVYQLRQKLIKNRSKLPIIDIDLRRQMTLNELASLKKPYQQAAGPWLQQLNTLLKRLCLIRYGDQGIKTLTGQAWLDYLDSKCKEARIKQFPMLVVAQYHPNYYMDDETIDNLYSSIEEWINHHV